MSAATPKYRLIAEALAADIAAGRFKPGDQVPSERVIAGEMGISRMTVRQALGHLADRGIVESRVGHGTFVGVPTIQQQLSTLTGFTEEMERQGRKPGSIIVEALRRPAEPAIAAALGLRARGEVFRIKRVRLADGEPVAIETTEIPVALAPDLLERADLASTSLYDTLRAHYGLRPTEAEQTLAAAAADPEVALSLGVAPGAPVLRLTRLTRDVSGLAIEHVRSVYRGDAFVMKVHLTLTGGAE